MTKSVISIARKQDGSVDVNINVLGDAPAAATINIPAGSAAIMIREMGRGTFESFTWASD